MPTDGTYGFLDQLSTEQLTDLLRADFDASEDGDNEMIFRILEVIERREEESLPTADQAWEDFQKYFNTPDGTGRPLYPMRASTGENAETAERTAPRRGRPLRRLLPLSAAAAVTLSCMITAQALGVDVFGTLARWTEDTFHFVTGAPDPAQEALRQAVQGAFDEYGVTVPAPAWYPEGTMLAEDIDVVKAERYTLLICNFLYNDKSFFIQVQQYFQPDRVDSYTLEKDVSDAEEYPSNGRSFYITSNLSAGCAVYSNDQTIITINGDLSLEALKHIIDSIGE